jgi:hypothetical protein
MTPVKTSKRFHQNVKTFSSKRQNVFIKTSKRFCQSVKTFLIKRQNVGDNSVYLLWKMSGKGFTDFAAL